MRFDPSASAGERAEARAEAGARLADVTSMPGVQLLEVVDDRAAPQATAKLDSNPLVEYAEPNWILRPWTPPIPAIDFSGG